MQNNRSLSCGEKRRKQWFALDLTTLQPYSMRKLIIHVLMEADKSLESKEPKGLATY
jgi:hypothetical protein